MTPRKSLLSAFGLLIAFSALPINPARAAAAEIQCDNEAALVAAVVAANEGTGPSTIVLNPDGGGIYNPLLQVIKVKVGTVTGNTNGSGSPDDCSPPSGFEGCS